MTEDIFEIGGDGGTRRGLVTLPASGEGHGIGVLLLPCGLKNRSGPHRFYVDLSRRLAAIGYAVLRFDPLGLGESDAMLETASVREIWRSVESGRFVADAVLAGRALRERLCLRRLVVGGICGGALTGLLAAAHQPALFDGVVSLNTAAILDPDENAPAPVGAAQARHNLASYVRKAGSVEAWARLLRGEANVAGLRGTIARFRRRPTGHPHENPVFMPAFRALEQRRVPHLLVFGGNDTRWLEFQDAVLTPYLGPVRHGEGFEIHVVRDANHEFYLGPWKKAVVDSLLDWLGRRFPGTPAYC